MVVLSLFDGMSCGQIALRELGVTIDRYYASEVDKFAIQNTLANFPDTVQLGDVRQVDARSLGKVDLLIGGIFAEKSPTLSANSWQQNNLLVSRPKDGIRQLNPSCESGGTQPYQQNRVYTADGKSPALMNGHGGQTINALVGGLQVRRLTPTECARLQTIPEWYKWEVSETQQYRMLGNGWTVEVIKHILSFLPEHLKK